MPVETLPIISNQLNEISETDYRFHQFVHHLPAAVYTCDAQGYIKLYNQTAVKLWGREPEPGKDLWCGSWRIYRTDGTPLPLDSCPMAIALKEGRTGGSQEIVIERPDGVRRNLLVHPQLILDASGKIVEGFNLLVDITEHKQAEAALRESEERFRTVANTAPVMIWMANPDRQLCFFNNGWLHFTGNTLKEATEKGWAPLLHPDDREQFLSNYEAFCNWQETINLECRLKRYDGVYRWVSCSAVPRYAPGGSFQGYIGSCIDIEDKKLLEEALEKEVAKKTKDLKDANAELERSNKELEQFAYAASHDMQEPLRKIQTFVTFLVENAQHELSEGSRIYLSKIQNSAKRMSDIIDALLNYSQSVSIQAQFRKTNLNTIIEGVAADLELLIQQKNALVVCEDLPEIWAIPSQMNQLFFNLINNSLKFSQPEVRPQIKISAGIAQQALSGPCFIDIKVEDNGIGFDPKYSEKIFHLFQRLNDKYSYTGTGIGLALCKKIVENHNGKISASSEKGQGAVFHISLPAALMVSNN